MGRPVQKRQFGDPAAIDGNQLFMFGDIGAGVEQVWVVSQRSTRIFLVESVSSSNQGEILLVDGPGAVTGIGFGYLEAGGSGGNFEVDSITSVAAGGDTYDVAETVTLAGTGTGAVVTVALVTPIDAQTHTDYSVFSAGITYSVSDVITMTDGTTVTVVAVSTGNITEFLVDSSTAVSGLATNVTLAQASVTPDNGSGFDMTLADDNQAIWSVTLTSGGDYSVDLTNPVGQSATSGIGTGATFNVITSSSSNVYVSLLSNKNLKTFGQVGGRQSYLINDDGASINIPGA